MQALSSDATTPVRDLADTSGKMQELHDQISERPTAKVLKQQRDEDSNAVASIRVALGPSYHWPQRSCSCTRIQFCCGIWSRSSSTQGATG